MKKLFFAVLAAALVTGAVSFAQEASVAGGFEASGHAFVGTGWQKYNVNGGGLVAIDVNGTTAGPMGAYSTASRGGAVLTSPANNEDDFKFFADEVELDIAKTFGENIRLRADLDFGSSSLYSGPRFTNGGGAADESGILVEQAYATTNLALGNGVELLFGRFNAPFGFESVDVNENDTVSRSTIYRALRPRSFTGAKIYYSFSDLIDLNLFVANNGLTHDDGDIVDVNSDIPSAGFRLGFNWGEEGKQSHLGWTGAWGQDHGNFKNGWTFLADADWQWWATDSFALGGEAIYRQIDSRTPLIVNGKYLGGLLNLHYDFSDVWDGTLKYGYAHDVNGATPGVAAGFGTNVATTWGGAAQSLTGADQQIHEVALAGNYAITDAATLKLEGNVALLNPTGAANNRQVFGVVGGFAYAF